MTSRTGFSRRALRGGYTAVLGAAALLSALSPFDAANAAVGRFQFVFGQVVVTDKNGQERAVRRGSEVEEGDVIKTTGRGTAQLKMADGAALAVRPRSEVRIDAYQFKNESGSDRSFLSLLRGTLRSITGLIGRSNRNAYRVTTPSATIGIRGSDADIGFNPQNGLTAVRTYAGGHSLTAPDANGVDVTIETNPGQIAVAVPGQTPGFSQTFPFSTPAPQAGAGGGQARGEAQQNQQQQQRRAQQQARRPGGTPGGPPPAQQQNAGGPGGPATGGPIASGQVPQGSFALSSARVAPFGTASAGGALVNQGATKTAASGTVVANNNGTIILDGNNRPIVVTDNAPGGGSFQLFRNNAALVGPRGNFSINDNTGNTVSQGNWGAYDNRVTIVNNGIPQQVIGNFHFISATNRTPVANVQALGGTSFSYQFPQQHMNFSNELGKFATVRNVLANGTGNGNINITVQASGFGGGSDNYNLTGSGNVLSFIGPQGVGLSGGYSAGTIGAANASASGKFLGNTGQGIIMSVGARDPGNGNGLAGTAAGIKN